MVNCSIKSSFTNKSVTITNATSVSGGCVNGNVCVSALFSGITAPINTWVGLGTINIVPNNSDVYTVGIKTANGHFAGMVRLDTNGYLQLYAAEAFSNNSVAFTVCYKEGTL